VSTIINVSDVLADGVTTGCNLNPLNWKNIPFDTGALTGNITLNYGDKVWLSWFVSETITTGPYVDDLVLGWDYDDAEFSIEIDSLTAPSIAKTFLVHEAFNQVADSIADANFSFYSDFYGRTNSDKTVYNSDGCGALIAITNGLNIRQFADKGIYCSLRDLFNVFNSLHNIGLTIEQYDGIYAPLQDIIRVEQLSYFYDNTANILTLTNQVKVDVINDNSRYVNNINIGYDKWETEFRGGLDEPCTKHEYSTKINAVKGQYTKLSKYMASGYAIESTRRKSLEESKDWRYDNDNFLVTVKNGVDVYFVEGNVIFTTKIAGSDINIGDSMTISTPLNSYAFTVQNVYEIFPTETYPIYVIVVDAPDVVIQEPTVTGVLQNITESWTRTGAFYSFIQNGSGGIVFNSIITAIQPPDTLQVTNTVFNDGTKNVIEADRLLTDPFLDIENEKTLIVFNEAGIAETANNALIHSDTNNLDFYSTELYADAFTNGTGMTSLTTAYNLRLTPARMLLAHMNIITACIQIVQGLISFVKGEGNTTLETTKNDVGCPEDYNESIPYVDAGLIESRSFDWNDPNVKNITPIWLPEIYKFSYPLTASQLASVRANPNGYIEVTDDHSNVRRGFILDLDYNLKTGLTKFELLKMFE